LMELVAGLIDKDEEPEAVAHREAEEEAGLTLGALWPITSTSRRRVAAMNWCTCSSVAATAVRPPASMVCRRRARTSASMCGVRRCLAGGARREDQ
jgi:8-oxo-dGTP pyrophosphatase MutT (NUDIX family)